MADQVQVLAHGSCTTALVAMCAMRCFAASCSLQRAVDTVVRKMASTGPLDFLGKSSDLIMRSASFVEWKGATRVIESWRS
jgi:hypothetical protein